MRILHVLNHTGRLNGNVHAAIDVACAQSRLGHQVAVASAGGSFDDVLAANSVETIIIELRRRPLELLSALMALNKLIRRFDVVHAHMMTSALLCWPVSKVMGIPLVTTVHNEFQRSATLMGVGQRVIAVSGAVARSMEARGIAKSRLRTVLNGTVGTPRHPTEAGPPMALGKDSILFVGGQHPRKGVPILLEAFQSVKETIPTATLHIVGEGPFEVVYKVMAALMSSADAIKFYGPQDDPRPWFLGADVFVMPSLSEPAGLVISEACEAGCAIIASNVGGIPEMLDDGRAGKLVPPNDPDRLAAEIIALLSAPSALAESRRLAQANASRMSLERVARQTLAIYDECLQ